MWIRDFLGSYNNSFLLSLWPARHQFYLALSSQRVYSTTSVKEQIAHSSKRPSFLNTFPIPKLKNYTGSFFGMSLPKNCRVIFQYFELFKSLNASLRSSSNLWHAEDWGGSKVLNQHNPVSNNNKKTLHYIWCILLHRRIILISTGLNVKKGCWLVLARWQICWPSLEGWLTGNITTKHWLFFA